MNYLDTIKQVRVRKFATIDCEGDVTFRVWENGTIEQWFEEDMEYYPLNIDNFTPEEEVGIRAIGLQSIKEQA